MVLILLAWDSILWFTKSSFNFRRSSWQNSRYTIKIDWQAFFLLLDAIFVSFLNNLNPPKINQNFVYILIFGLVFITKNSKIIWNKHILDSKKKNFASADNHLYIKSLHLWSQLMYWKKKNIPCCYSNQGSWMSLYLQNGMLSRRWDRWTGKRKWWQWLLAQTY